MSALSSPKSTPAGTSTSSPWARTSTPQEPGRAVPVPPSHSPKAAEVVSGWARLRRPTSVIRSSTPVSSSTEAKGMPTTGSSTRRTLGSSSRVCPAPGDPGSSPRP
ncbi:hypothetical protein [Streptomyces sp. NPDC057682]|uniref:hypothetical protein n=1 Tax=Streptomyces sp. NPDC057682 TaxID=3346210 RepID=UPI003677CC1B